MALLFSSKKSIIIAVVAIAVLMAAGIILFGNGLVLVSFPPPTTPTSSSSIDCTLFEVKSPVDKSTLVEIMNLEDGCLSETNKKLAEDGLLTVRGICAEKDCVVLLTRN